MRAGAELDELLRALRPVCDRHEARNPEIAGDVQHPQAAPGLGELDLQIADIRIVEAVEVHRGPLQAIVPPDRIRISFHQLEETLDDRLLERVAGRAAVGVRVEPIGRVAPVEKIQQAGR